MDAVIVDNESAPELTMTFQEFADQKRVSLRTVHRWAYQGKLNIIERQGRRVVDAAAPMRETPLDDKRHVRRDSPIATGEDVTTLVPTDIFSEFVTTLKTSTTKSDKARVRWQVAFFVTAILCFAALIIGAAGGMYLSQTKIATEVRLTDLQIQQSALASRLIDANLALSESGASHAEAVGQLQQRLDMKNAQILELSAQIKVLSDKILELSATTGQ